MATVIFCYTTKPEVSTTLSLYENMYAGYFMGNPLYKDYYKDYGCGSVEPRIAYYDYKNGIFLEDANQDEIPESVEFKLIDKRVVVRQFQIMYIIS